VVARHVVVTYCWPTGGAESALPLSWCRLLAVTTTPALVAAFAGVRLGVVVGDDQGGLVDLKVRVDAPVAVGQDGSTQPTLGADLLGAFLRCGEHDEQDGAFGLHLWRPCGLRRTGASVGRRAASQSTRCRRLV
jgi:hypothetical protein